MTFRPFDPETLAELSAIQARINAINSRYTAGPVGLDAQMVCQLERDRDAIYQADYDLSRQHR